MCDRADLLANGQDTLPGPSVGADTDGRSFESDFRIYQSYRVFERGSVDSAKGGKDKGVGSRHEDLGLRGSAV